MPRSVFQVLSDDEIETIEHKADQVLEEIGLELDEEVRQGGVAVRVAREVPAQAGHERVAGLHGEPAARGHVAAGFSRKGGAAERSLDGHRDPGSAESVFRNPAASGDGRVFAAVLDIVDSSDAAKINGNVLRIEKSHCTRSVFKYVF